VKVSEGNFPAKYHREKASPAIPGCRGRRGQRGDTQEYVCTPVSSQAQPMPTNGSRSWGPIQSPLQFLGRPTDFSELWLSLQGGQRGFFHTRLPGKEDGAGPSDVFIQVKPPHTCLREQPPGAYKPLTLYCSFGARTLF